MEACSRCAPKLKDYKRKALKLAMDLADERAERKGLLEQIAALRRALRAMHAGEPLSVKILSEIEK
jgi:hypothetical protein